MASDKERVEDFVKESDLYGLFYSIDDSNGGRNENNLLVLSNRIEVIDVLYKRLMETYNDYKLSGLEKDQEIAEIIAYYVDRHDLQVLSSDKVVKIYEVDFGGYRDVTINLNGKHNATYPCRVFVADYK
jgi:hypothetical protein